MSNQKICKKCLVLKPYSEFYTDKTMASGCINFCKPCAQEKRKNTSLKNKDKRLAAKRQYQKTDRAKKLKKDWYFTNKGRQYRNKLVSSWRAKNPEKRDAHNTVSRAIKSGLLIKKPCEVCFEIKYIHAHHDDYKKPLEIKWLCAKHHHERHKILKENKK